MAFVTIKDERTPNSKMTNSDVLLNSLSEPIGIEIFAIKLLEAEAKAKPE